MLADKIESVIKQEKCEPKDYIDLNSDESITLLLKMGRELGL